MKRFTKAQRGQVEKLTGDVLESLGPGREEMQNIILKASRARLFQERVRALFVELLALYFIPLTDEEALIWLAKQARVWKSKAQQLVNGCRNGANELGFVNSVPCHYAVALGATLKGTIPTLGPCVEEFKYLQDWQFADVPTEHCLVSGVPVALRETTSQTLATQFQTLAAVENRWGVPKGFFSKELLSTVYVAGVALTHFNLTKRDMFGDLRIRTGSCYSGGYRLYLSWYQGRLHCGSWHWGDRSYSDLAVAALGVTKALGH